MEKDLKDILLKDLCARLPYGVKCKYYNVYENCYEEGTILGFERKEHIEIDGRCANVEEVKPYLFPLSSMTEEQKKEMSSFDPFQTEETKTLGQWAFHLVDFYNKYHFDYRGLIPKGIALDATGLNIY